MKIIKTINKLCPLCMKTHKVNIVKVIETENYKNKEISYEAIYEYCSNTDEYLETEEMIRKNFKSLKNTYIKK